MPSHRRPFPTRPPSRQDLELARLARVKRREPEETAALGAAMIDFFKQSVQKRQGKLAKIAECWQQLVPVTLNQHCALESFGRGTLTVLVDSSSHLYELKQLLLAGLQQQLLLACGTAGLRKIALKPGRWYEGDESAGDRKLRFN
jgi:hypothetical protein